MGAEFGSGVYRDLSGTSRWGSRGPQMGLG
jgi:hypothetical protein